MNKLMSYNEQKNRILTLKDDELFAFTCLLSLGLANSVNTKNGFAYKDERECVKAVRHLFKVHNNDKCDLDTLDLKETIKLIDKFLPIIDKYDYEASICNYLIQDFEKRFNSNKELTEEYAKDISEFKDKTDEEMLKHSMIKAYKLMVEIFQDKMKLANKQQ